MGGLKKHLPITYWTFLIGALAIAGVPLLSGFFSKDEILFRTFTRTAGHTLLWLIGVMTSLLTAIYMFRLVFLAFHGERRHDAHGGRSSRRRRAGAAHRARHGATRAAPHGGHGRPRRPWALHARGALVDGDSADRARDRVDLRRLRRRAARARRQQPHRDVPRAELRGRGAPRAGVHCGVALQPRLVDARRSPLSMKPQPATRPRTAADERHRADADGVSPAESPSPASASRRTSGCGNRDAADALARRFQRLYRLLLQQVLRGRALRCGHRAADQAAVDRRRCGRAWTPGSSTATVNGVGARRAAPAAARCAACRPARSAPTPRRLFAGVVRSSAITCCAN